MTLNHLPPHTNVPRAALSWPGLWAHGALTRGTGPVGAFAFCCRCRWEKGHWCLFFFSEVKNRGLGCLLHLFSIQWVIAAATQLHHSLLWLQSLQSHKSAYIILLSNNYKIPVNFCYLVFHFRLLVRMAEKLLDLLFQFPYVVAGINC